MFDYMVFSGLRKHIYRGKISKKITDLKHRKKDILGMSIVLLQCKCNILIGYMYKADT